MSRDRRLSILLALSAALTLAACGGQGLPTAPEDAAEGYDDFDSSGQLPMDSFTPGPEAPLPDPVPSVSPSAAASAAPPSWGGPPNDFRRKIGKGFLSNWLHRPAGLAAAGNLVFIGDGHRSSLRGEHGAVLAFDGAGEDAFTTPVGMYYERRVGAAPQHLLTAGVSAVAVTESLVLASDDQGVKGFIRAIPENAINGGAPIAPPCRDMALAGGILYMAQSGQVAALKEGSWTAAPGLNREVQGLGSDATGRLWVVTRDRVTAYQGGEQVLDFDGRGTDGTGPATQQLQDVAVDPRNGEVYALDRGQVLRFDASGKFLASFGGGRIGQGSRLAVGPDGSVYVSDAQDGEVYQFRPGR